MSDEPLEAKWDHGPYPQGRSFGELLDWHLVYWGTTFESNKTDQNKPWKLGAFAAEIYSGYKEPKTADAWENNLRSWRLQGRLPHSSKLLNNILWHLFGGNSDLSDWKDELEAAYKREKKAKQTSSKSAAVDEVGDAKISADASLSVHEVESIRGDVRQFADMQTEHGEMLRFLVASEMARRGGGITKAGVTDEAVIRLAKRISERVENPDHALAELGAALDELLQLRAEAKRGSNLDADVEAVLHRIGGQARAGRFEEADREAERAFQEWERREAERREREKSIGMLFAEENIRTKRLLRDAEGVAFWIARHIEIKVGVEVVGYVELGQEIDDYIVSGRGKCINFDLEVAVELIQIAERHSGNALEQASLQNALGITLRVLGERQGGTALLKAAVSSHYLARDVYTHAGLPLEWAMTQHNLGIALRALGERQEGTASLEAAAAAYHFALEVHTRSDLPLDWARTQNNLGNVLGALGERQEGGEALQAAVMAHKSALEVHTRAEMPFEWANTQSDLGNALAVLGERQEGTASLEAAVTAYRSALEVYTYADWPLDWARTQNNLGNALAALGERQKGTVSLEAAVMAHRAALEIYTQADWPLDWAMTRDNLGNALAALGERQEGTASLEAAVTAFLSALEIRTRADLPLGWASTQNNLGNALSALGERQEEAAALELAVAAYRSALEVYTRAYMPVEWGMTQRNLERTLESLKSKQV